MINTISQKCVACGTPFRGRADKKFCSDSCRSSHYNIVNARSREHMRRIHCILKRNHKILDELKSEGRESVSAENMKVRGFNFNYCTSYRYSKDGGLDYYCYDVGFRLDDRGDRVILLENDSLRS